MPSTPRHDMQFLVEKAAAEHHVLAETCERRWCDELAERRRAMAAECERVLARIRRAS